VGLFSSGLAPVQKAGKWGFIDREGDYLVRPQFDDLAGRPLALIEHPTQPVDIFRKGLPESRSVKMGLH